MANNIVTLNLNGNEYTFRPLYSVESADSLNTDYTFGLGDFAAVDGASFLLYFTADDLGSCSENIGFQTTGGNQSWRAIYANGLLKWQDLVPHNFYEFSYRVGSGFHLTGSSAEMIDTSNFVTQANLTSAVTQLTTNIAKKQDKLVSGTNIITINSNSILGSGNLDLATTEQLRNFQPMLVSGTNIKTINNESIVGSGNIIIPMNLKYIHISNASTGNINVSLQPNACVYLANNVGSGTSRTTLNITAPSSNNALISSTNNGDLIESSIIFSIPAGATPTIVFDLDIDNNSSSDMRIKWVNDTPPTFTAGKTYEINFIYPATSGVGLGLGAWVAF